MNTKQYNLDIFRKKKRFRIILESLRSPLNQEQTVVLLLQAVTQDVVLPHAVVLCKFEGCRAFPNSTGYYSDMDGLSGSWTVPLNSSALHCQWAVITFLYLMSFPCCQFHQERWSYATIKTQHLSGLFFTHIKSAEGQGISLGAVVFCVLVEWCSDLFLWILLKLYTSFSIFVRRQQNDATSSFLFLFFPFI